MKTALGLVIGLIVGVVAMLVFRPSNLTSADREAAIGISSNTSLGARDDALLEGRVGAIETRLDELTDELRNLASEFATRKAADSSQLSASETRALTDSIRTLRGVTPNQTPSESLVDRLVAGGFSRERAEWINRFQNEQAMAAIEARYESVRSGAEPAAISVASTSGGDQALRRELGDAEYEQYLRALERNSDVNIMEVLANSPAERAGFRPGDRIRSYGGTRVFDLAEVTPLTAQGTPGESVVVDILRDGQPMQIVVPRGPLGVRLMGNSSPSGVAVPQ